MTKLTANLMIAAAMMVATGVASAQPTKADVPFAFRVSGKTMSAGSYTVSTDSKGLTQIRATDGQSGAYALASSRIEGGESGEARLVFSCANGSCILMQVWNPNGTAYVYPPPKDRDYEASLVVIPLHRNAD